MKKLLPVIFPIVCSLIWVALLNLRFEHPMEALATNWIYILVGFGAAVAGNISAVGGGIVFIPAMMFIFHLPAIVSLKIAIGSQSIGMSSGAFAWFRDRKIPWPLIKISVPFLLAGSLVSSVLIHPNALYVKVLFGPFSICLGVLTLVLLRKKKGAPLELTEEFIAKIRWPLSLAAFLGGLVTGWIAIGEGELVSALFMLVYGLESAACIALGVILLAVNSVFLTLVHSFVLDGIPWNFVIFTGFGCIFGARAAVWLSKRVSPVTLKAIFASLAIVDGILFIYQFVMLHPK